MAQTQSTMLELGTSAPAFSLLEPATGNTVSVDDFQGQPALLVMFICNHCPFVKHIRQALATFAQQYQPQGLAVVAISSNDVANYPDDSPEKMMEEVKTMGYSFPYLYDADQTVAKAYRAACTPDFYLFDENRQLVYRGQFDASRPGNSIPITGADLRAAVDALLANQPLPTDQRPSIGCNIKWKAGQEPDYFR